MVLYKLSSSDPVRQFLQLEAQFEATGSILKLQLPAWRPGRYELGNFSQYVRGFKAFDTTGRVLSHRKITKDLWEIETPSTQTVVVHYEFFAAQLNAGSTYIDATQLYVNPVNCFFYNPEHVTESYQVQLDIPSHWKIATSLKMDDNQKLMAADFQEMADSPFIASPDLEHLLYETGGVKFHIWIQGKHQLDSQRLIQDHIDFSKLLIHDFGKFPVEEYHFLYQFPEFRLHHGVEHTANTVITLGPASELHLEEKYKEIIGIACHELYHSWNVKTIRPIEMQPYDFTQENFTVLGYVAEGVTTYFGDHYLWRTGFYDDETYLNILAKTIRRHLHNEGRLNHSLEDSSTDTWVDGYSSGVAGRKVSIYNEGCLVAFLTDVALIEKTNGRYNLSEVMRRMNKKFGLTRIGYAQQDYLNILKEVGGVSFERQYSKWVAAPCDLMPDIIEALEQLGLEIEMIPTHKLLSGQLGVITNGKNEILRFDPESPLLEHDVMYGDCIVAVNGNTLTSDSSEIENTSRPIISIQRKQKSFEIEVRMKSNLYPDLKVNKTTTRKSAKPFIMWKNAQSIS